MKYNKRIKLSTLGYNQFGIKFSIYPIAQMSRHMMIKPKVYLDTTVPSVYFDDRTPDRQRLTKQFWTGRLPDCECIISAIFLMEILDMPDSERRDNIKGLVDNFKDLPPHERVKFFSLLEKVPHS